MTGLRKLRIVLALGAAFMVAGCSGADEVASPGEGIFNDPGGSGSSGGNAPLPPGTPAADCPAGFSNVGLVANDTLRNCQLPSLISGNLTVPLRAGTVYSVSGRVDVGVDRGGDSNNPVGTFGNLTVEAGVRVFGSAGLDYIVVNRGSQIFAVGTPTSPVVFTSRQSVEGTTGVDSIGQWGGLVMLGRANITNCPGATGADQAGLYGQPGCHATVEGTNAEYGGNQNADNSGTLRYVRVQHSGFQILPNQELNGITLAGVGSGTTIDHVQVHNSSDDGVEMFGGTVNIKYLVLTGNDDDNIDTDQGYNGAIQFVILVQRANGGNRTIESSMASLAATIPPQDFPARRTNPVVANFTFVGSSASTAADGLTINTGSRFRLYNGVATTAHATAPCLDIDNTADSTATFRSVFMSCPVSFAPDVDTIEESVTFGAGTNNNTAGGTSTLTNTFVNGANETAVTPVTYAALADAELPPAHKAFLTTVTYIGAVKDAADTWWQGWTCGLAAGSTC